ncbi:cytochrome c biogenesis protein [Pseudoneobacillus sp. C159]
MKMGSNLSQEPLSKLNDSNVHRFLVWATVFSLFTSLYLIFIYAPLEKTMREVQKIFYIHVSSAWVAFLAFFVVFILSILFLVTRKRIYDIYAGVSAEIGVVFTTIVMTTGPIWARSSWNTWWAWEPRLTTSLILWFIYLAYIMIRQMDGAWDKKARLSAVFGIIGFIDVPIVFMAIRWWQSKFHPIVFGDGPSQKGGGVEPEMLVALIAMTFTFTLFYVVLLQKGVTIQKAKIKVENWKEQLREKLVS